MALVVEDGTGLSNADSYVSEADADTYHTAHGDPSAWSGATTAAKEAGLRLATQYLDAVYGTVWQGDRINSTMSLDWPRNSVVDSDGYTVSATAVPTAIEHACAYLALKQVGGDTLIPDISTGTNITSESVTVGPISTSKTYGGDKGPIKRYRLVDFLLADLVLGGTRVYRS